MDANASATPLDKARRLNRHGEALPLNDTQDCASGGDAVHIGDVLAQVMPALGLEPHENDAAARNEQK